jgi:hypothetical protein
MASVSLLRKAASLTVIQDPQSPSRFLTSDGTKVHVVRYSGIFKRFDCDCTAALHGAPNCSHRLAVRHFQEQTKGQVA